MKQVELRRLNDQGMARMGEFLDSLTGDSPQQCPRSILTDGRTSESLPVKVLVEEDRVFPRRYEAAEYLYNLLSSSALREPERDRGLWAWLALLWFDQLCPPDKTGQRKPGERARWIPEVDASWGYYRHLLRGPYLIYSLYKDSIGDAMCLLCQPLHRPGDVVEQLASRQSLVTSRALIGAATRLYYDNRKNGLVRGASGKGRGSPRRLAEVAMQFDRTFDLHTIDTEGLLKLLPREFDGFRMQTAGAKTAGPQP